MTADDRYRLKFPPDHHVMFGSGFRVGAVPNSHKSDRIVC